MCKCCQHCLESCYWNLIEEKFCFDESIALYEEPVKKPSNEKNNNMFENMAFYDSVSVIAGRSIVTIDPSDAQKRKKKNEAEGAAGASPPHPAGAAAVVVEQPRRLKWPGKNSKALEKDYLKMFPLTRNENPTEKNSTDTDGTDSEPHEKLIHKKRINWHEKAPIKKSVSFHNIPDNATTSSSDECDFKAKTRSTTAVPEEEEVTLRGKSLRERRMSKSLSLKIGDIPKELPIIRQNSMPKFYLDTPDENQMRDSALIKNSGLALKSPLTSSSEFNFDLYSVVQMQKDLESAQPKKPPVPIHRETSKLNLIKDKILLKKSKSTVSASNLPYSNHM